MTRYLLSLFLVFVISSVVFAQSDVDFKDLEVIGPFRVVLIKDARPHIEINYSQVSEEDVIVENSGDKVSIRLRNKRYVDAISESDNHNDLRPINVKVYYSDLHEVKAQASAEIRSDQSLVLDELSLQSTMGAIIDLKVQCGTLHGESLMGSTLRLAGTANYFDVSASMGGVVRSYQLKSKEVKAKANMGGNIYVYATDEVDASANFGGIVQYDGTPPRQNTSTTFGGEVRD